MYSTRSNLILGFHGCEKVEQQKLISDPSYIRSSNESFDWLGHGMYFWENVDRPKTKGHDKVLRYLDCAVIEYTHSFLKAKGESSYDSVRAAFIEGRPIYSGAGFNEKTHIQICIINPNCIKGFFLLRTKSKT